MESYGIRKDSMLDLNSFQNFVYSGMIGNREVILRIAHITHWDKTLTKTEIDFIMFLSESGEKVARPINSLTGDLLDTIDDAFVVTAFEKAPGRHANIAKFDRIIGEVSALSKDKNTYGLIHGDVSSGNYLNNGDNAHLIDFDQEVRKEITKRFFSNFLNGYGKESTVSEEWLKKIPLFIDLRQAIVLSALYRSRDFNAPDWSEWDEQAVRQNGSMLLDAIQLF